VARRRCDACAAADASSISARATGCWRRSWLLLDNSSPAAIVVDPALPLSTAPVHRRRSYALARLTGRVRFVAESLDTITLGRQTSCVSSHACGALRIAIEAAALAGARVAVLPCCHDSKPRRRSLTSWLESSLATLMCVRRATSRKPTAIACGRSKFPRKPFTPKNRLLIGVPHAVTNF